MNDSFALTHVIYTEECWLIIQLEAYNNLAYCFYSSCFIKSLFASLYVSKTYYLASYVWCTAMCKCLIEFINNCVWSKLRTDRRIYIRIN